MNAILGIDLGVNTLSMNKLFDKKRKIKMTEVIHSQTKFVWFNYNYMVQQKNNLKKASASILFRIKRCIKLIFSMDDLTTEMHIKRCRAAKHHGN